MVLVRSPTPRRDVSPLFAANLTPDLGSATSCARAGVARARARSRAAGRFMTGSPLRRMRRASGPELVAGHEPPAVEKEAQRGPQRPETVDDALAEADRGGVLEIAARHRDLDHRQAEVHRLEDDLGVEDEAVGVAEERDRLEEPP